jgi:hypothetical protein
MLPDSPEDLVGLASGNPFETVRDPFKGNKWIKKNVNVVGHNGECFKRVLMQFTVTAVKCRNHATGDGWLVQPKRPCASFVQSPVGLEEFLASRFATLLP